MSTSRPPRPALALPAGIGLRAEHGEEFLRTRPDVGFIEVHAENCFGLGGRPLDLVRRARRDHPLGLHGVGLSLGSTDPLSRRHLRLLDELVRELRPAFVSDHLCWTSHGGIHANELLPLPYTDEALDHVVARVGEVQEALGRQIVVENVSSYFEYAASTWAEPDFLAELARRAGCGILLDVNNVWVSACNHGFDPVAYLHALPRDGVFEIHLAGHVRRTFDDGELLLDTHSAPVCDDVWRLYEEALCCFGAVPTLIEWDADLPPLATLLDEARKADARLAAFERGELAPRPASRVADDPGERCRALAA